MLRIASRPQSRSLVYCQRVELLGYFHCEGAPSPPIEGFIRSTIITDDAQWAEYGEEVKKHPTDEDIQAARTFIRDLLSDA